MHTQKQYSRLTTQKQLTNQLKESSQQQYCSNNYSKMTFGRQSIIHPHYFYSKSIDKLNQLNFILHKHYPYNPKCATYYSTADRIQSNTKIKQNKINNNNNRYFLNTRKFLLEQQQNIKQMQRQMSFTSLSKQRQNFTLQKRKYRAIQNVYNIGIIHRSVKQSQEQLSFSKQRHKIKSSFKPYQNNTNYLRNIDKLSSEIKKGKQIVKRMLQKTKNSQKQKQTNIKSVLSTNLIKKNKKNKKFSQNFKPISPSPTSFDDREQTNQNRQYTNQNRAYTNQNTRYRSDGVNWMSIKL